MTVYAIGDIHGHLGLLHAAHARIEADRKRTGAWDAPIVHIGDLVDRGPNSAGVIDFMMTEQARDPRIVVLMGNHDRMMAHWVRYGAEKDPEARTKLAYLNPRIGGGKTMASYGLDETMPEPQLHAAAERAVPDNHISFIEELPRFYQAEECFFVHAGIRPGIPLEEQRPSDLLWIRKEFLYANDDHGPLIVHGHTPVETIEHMGNRLNIDTGAAFGGPLTAVAIEGRDAFDLTQTERVPVQRLL